MQPPDKRPTVAHEKCGDARIDGAAAIMIAVFYRVSRRTKMTQIFRKLSFIPYPSIIRSSPLGRQAPK
jgi:hypothetical protein